GRGDHRRLDGARLRERRGAVQEERGRAVRRPGPQRRRRPLPVRDPQGLRVDAPHRVRLRRGRRHPAAGAQQPLRLHLPALRLRRERRRRPRGVPVGDAEDHARHRRRPRVVPHPDGARGRRPQLPQARRGPRDLEARRRGRRVVR
ncbi:uncharacterized protein J3R85_013563, partial [Psidium guajava]